MSFSTLIDTQETGPFSQPTQLGNHAVLFKIEGHLYAVQLPNVERVLRMCALTPVPEFPTWMPGVIDLQGEIVPVVDIGQRFGLPPRSIHPDGRLLIIRTSDQILALITDEVSEVLEIPIQEIALPPDFQMNLQLLAGMIRWQDKLILVLKTDYLLDPTLDVLDLEYLEQLLAEKSVTSVEPDPIPADDLTQIRGLGKVYAQRLQNAGIWTFANLSNSSTAALKTALGEIRGRRPDLASWQVQAEELTLKQD